MRHGFLLVDKQAGPTSHDIVSQVRRLLPERSIGHLGTLDPAATGLLVLAVGRKALKVVELFSELPKEYEATVRLGAVSTTYDIDGVIDERGPPSGWALPDPIVLRCLIHDRFLGRIQQVPPAYSAISVGGERAYRKARQGRGVELPSREVFIQSCDVLSYAYPELRLRIACGSGTYIRSLAHDLGQLMHCGAYLAGLRRTRVGEWRVENASLPDRAAWTRVLPLKEVLVSFPHRDLTDEEWEDLRFGRVIEAEIADGTIGWHGGLPVALLRRLGEGAARARKVL